MATGESPDNLTAGQKFASKQALQVNMNMLFINKLLPPFGREGGEGVYLYASV